MSDDAWERLQRWRAGRRAAGDEALDALADIGELRRYLDQAELAGVRVARRDGRSWTEIATQLGITRQSAWEKWRDLDDAAAGAERTVEMAVADVVRDKQRRGSVGVPNVVGVTWDEA